jgi:hypothetical protein
MNNFVVTKFPKKLKELGFKEDCLAAFKDEEFKLIGIHSYLTNDLEYISIPLWQQVIDWFKEKYNIHIEITHHVTEQYDINYKYYVIKNPVDCIECYENAYYKTYEKVREQAILKAIDIIKSV